jgi:hypothetical protein
VGKIKTTYINQIYNKLYKRAINKLNLAERLSYIKRGNKRAHKVRDIGLRTLEA